MCNGRALLFTGLVWAAVILVSGCADGRHQSFARGSGQLAVEMRGFRSDTGFAILSLFADGDGFPGEMAKARRNQRVAIVDGQAHAVFAELPYGENAISVLHDEDNDDRMKPGWFGAPREGFGFSGRPDYNFGPPAFADTAFLLVSSQRAVVIAMSYDTARAQRQGARRAARGVTP